MKALIDQILKEIKRGENIDLYVAIVAAAILVILDLFGLTNPNWIFSLNLAILALVAFSLLGNRHRIESIKERIFESSHGVFLERFPVDFEDNISKANDLWIVGINLGTTSSLYFKNFRNALESGRKIRILILEPNGIANKLGATSGLPNQFCRVQQEDIIALI